VGGEILGIIEDQLFPAFARVQIEHLAQVKYAEFFICGHGLSSCFKAGCGARRHPIGSEVEERLSVSIPAA
jgi:hypothetical protein